MFKIKNKEAFTIIELIVVMAVIGILVLLAMPKFMNYTQKAKITQINSDTKQLENASERYYMDKNDWPKLTDVPYTSAQITTFAQEVTDKTGQVVTLDTSGSYYDIDYSKLQTYIKKPNANTHYVLQNPVGEIYYLKNLTTIGENRLTIPEVINNKPVAVITMTPGTALTTDNNITWGYSGSTDIDGDAITNVEWQGKQDTYTAGTYIVKLRVQDEHGLWSDWTSKSFTVSQYLSKVGQQLSVAESGWQRISNTDNKITYTGSGWLNSSYAGSYTPTLRYTLSYGDKINFSFYGTKLRIIDYIFTNRDSNVIITIDDKNYSYSTAYSPSIREATILLFEKTNLSLSNHKVTITKGTNDSSLLCLDVVDIDNFGYLIIP